MKPRRLLLDVEAWHVACAFSSVAAKIAAEMPREDIHLIAELVSSSGAVPTMIAAAYQAESEEEFQSFIGDAAAKLARFEEILLMAVDLGLIDVATKGMLYEHINRCSLQLRAEKASKNKWRVNSLELVVDNA